MRRKTDANLVRRNLSLPKDFVDQVRSLRVRTESSSDSEVIRRALTCYEQLADDVDQNVALYSVRSGGETVRLGVMSQMANADPKALVKVNLILHEGSDRRLDELRQKTGASSDSEVVRKALQFYALLMDEYDSGSKLELVFPDGSAETVRFWGVPRRPLREAAAAGNSAKLEPHLHLR